MPEFPAVFITPVGVFPGAAVKKKLAMKTAEPQNIECKTAKSRENKETYKIIPSGMISGAT